MLICLIHPIFYANLLVAGLAAIVLTVIWGLGQRARRVLRETQQTSQQKLRESDPMFDYSHLRQHLRQQHDPQSQLSQQTFTTAALKKMQQESVSPFSPSFPRDLLYRQLIAQHDPNLCVMCGLASPLAKQTGFCQRCTEMLNQRVARAEKESAE